MLKLLCAMDLRVDPLDRIPSGLCTVAAIHTRIFNDVRFIATNDQYSEETRLCRHYG